MKFFRSKPFFVILTAVLGLGVIVSLPVWKRIFQHLSERPKDASVVVANDNDRTMANVYYEFKDFDLHGYSQGKYPELEKLYRSRESWRRRDISDFSTSVKMQSFGIEKEICGKKWENLIPYLEECISGYRLFVPFRQETAAITFLRPFMNTIARIANRSNEIPPDIRPQVIMKLAELVKLVKQVPDESSNRFKSEFISGIEESISKLKN